MSSICTRKSRLQNRTWWCWRSISITILRLFLRYVCCGKLNLLGGTIIGVSLCFSLIFRICKAGMKIWDANERGRVFVESRKGEMHSFWAVSIPRDLHRIYLLLFDWACLRPSLVLQHSTGTRKFKFQHKSAFCQRKSILILAEKVNTFLIFQNLSNSSTMSNIEILLFVKPPRSIVGWLNLESHCTAKRSKQEHRYWALRG